MFSVKRTQHVFCSLLKVLNMFSSYSCRTTISGTSIERAYGAVYKLPPPDGIRVAVCRRARAKEREHAVLIMFPVKHIQYVFC